MGNNVLFYWSGGKDSAMAFHNIRSLPRYANLRVTNFLTTLTEGYDRISGHGIRRTVLERQAACIGIDLQKSYIPKQCTMEHYEGIMEDALGIHRLNDIHYAATGDIFMEKRRLVTLQKVGMHGCFPLWQKDAHEQARATLLAGFKAYVICVDSTVLDKSFVGRPFDEEFLRQLPVRVDPCGENGEYHTFVYDGPGFHNPVKCQLGETVFREGFYFTDVVLSQ